MIVIGSSVVSQVKRREIENTMHLLTYHRMFMINTISKFFVNIDNVPTGNSEIDYWWDGNIYTATVPGI